MGFFKKKPSPKHCAHKWKDFKWYIEATYYSSDNSFNIKIIEPYVCIYCKERKNVILKEHNSVCCTEREANNIYNNWEKRYSGNLEDRAIIEDKINDMTLVDREYLELYDKVVNPAKT